MAERQAGGVAAVREHLRPLGATGRGPFSAAAKRALDLVVAALALTALSPLFVLLAGLIVIDSGRPIFYRRRVLGRGGVPFDAWKLRTMRPAGQPAARQPIDGRATSVGGLQAGTLTVPDDPRITRLGRWLRRLSLDELPQLFNIFLGNMTFVGPRPIAADEVEIYGPAIERFKTVTPGITGLWQTCGRSEASYEKRVQMDLFYIDNRSILMDLWIIIATIPAVLLKRGAC